MEVKKIYGIVNNKVNTEKHGNFEQNTLFYKNLNFLTQ